MIFRRSLITELANTAGAVFTVIFSIVITIGLVRILSLAAGGRIDSGTVLEMVVYQSLINLAPLLAVSLFIAVLMTLSRSWMESEMVVWFTSGGISLLAWIRPILRFCFPIVLLIAALSTVISPWAQGQSDRNREVYQTRDDVDRLSPGRFIELNGGRQVFFIEEVSEDGLQVKNVFLTQTDVNKEMVVVAQAGNILVNDAGDRYVNLQNGRRYEGKPGSPEYRVTDFGSYALRLDVKPDQALQMTGVDVAPFPTLLAGYHKKVVQGEILWRISWPFVALNLILIAIPLSFTNPRAGRSLNMVVALLIFIFYLNAISVGRAWVESGTLSLPLTFILTNGLFSCLAALLFARRTVMQRWIPLSWYPSHWRKKD